MPNTENPYIYIVLNGTLRLYTPSGIMDYIAGQYSLSKIDTPLSGTVLGNLKQPFLALAIEFTVYDVITTILDLDNALIAKIMNEELDSTVMSLSDQAVLESVIRLFSKINHINPSTFIRKHLIREIIYFILCGFCGKQLIRSIVLTEQANEIYAINSWIKENFRSTFTVEDLADKMNISVSLFHQKFKNAVGMGPLQCQKRFIYILCYALISMKQRLFCTYYKVWEGQSCF